MKRPGQQWNIIEHNPPELMTIHKLLLPLTDEGKIVVDWIHALSLNIKT